MTPAHWQSLLFLTAAASTLFCAAVNAYTLRIAYPLWRSMDRDSFVAVHREYLRRLGPIITFPHIVMFFSSAALIWRRPVWVGGREAASLFVLDALVVAVSAFVAGPIHDRFTRNASLDERGLTMLVRISALRTVLLLGASSLVLDWLYRALP